MKLPDWRGRTVVCIASGPSLTAEDCELVRESGCPVIVTNTTFRLCPWADMLYAFDRPWWNHYKLIGCYFTGRLPVRPLLRPSIILDDQTRDAIRYQR